MGRIFLEHMDGDKLYYCAMCNINLTSQSHLLSNRFTGPKGRAYLFKKVVNLTYSNAVPRILSTGRHVVRDVFCKFCKCRLGWMYEYASDDDQNYKEGNIVLEKVCISEGLDQEESISAEEAGVNPLV